jgi:hypothetical protein
VNFFRVGRDWLGVRRLYSTNDVTTTIGKAIITVRTLSRDRVSLSVIFSLLLAYDLVWVGE